MFHQNLRRSISFYIRKLKLRALLFLEDGDDPEAVVGGFDHADVGDDIEVGFAIHGQDLIEPDDVSALSEALAEGAHDDVALDHGALVMVAVLNAVGRIGEDEVEVFKRHVFEAMGVVEDVGLEVGVAVDCGARQFGEINLSAKEMQG